MSRLHTVKGIAEKALELIGEFSPHDPAADPDDLQRTIEWIDIVVGHIIGTDAAYWLRPASIPIVLIDDQSDYDIYDAMGANRPPDGIFFVTHATISDSAGNDEPLELIAKNTYDEKSNKATTGKPEELYIDRLARPTMTTYPVQSNAGGFTVNLNVQLLSADLTRAGGKLSHGFPDAWQLFLAYRTASHIGDGPVRMLPESELRRRKGEADEYLRQLKAYNNREKAGTGRTAAYGA